MEVGIIFIIKKAQTIPGQQKTAFLQVNTLFPLQKPCLLILTISGRFEPVIVVTIVAIQQFGLLRLFRLLPLRLQPQPVHILYANIPMLYCLANAVHLILQWPLPLIVVLLPGMVL